MNYEFLRSIVFSKEKGDVSELRHHDVVRHRRGAKKTERRRPTDLHSYQKYIKYVTTRRGTPYVGVTDLHTLASVAENWRETPPIHLILPDPASSGTTACNDLSSGSPCLAIVMPLLAG